MVAVRMGEGGGTRRRGSGASWGGVVGQSVGRRSVGRIGTSRETKWEKETAMAARSGMRGGGDDGNSDDEGGEGRNDT